MPSIEPANDPLVIVVMGVSGCGKSTVAQFLAQRLKAHFKDGDELHPESNIDKMAAGIALSDDDREPWLRDVAQYAREQASKHGICVIACSALKSSYRDILNQAGQLVYVFLEGSRELIATRMHSRTGHFMPDTLLDSQFATLEDPRTEGNVVSVSIEPTPEQIADNAVQALRDRNCIAHI
jgi:gluconokinase